MVNAFISSHLVVHNIRDFDRSCSVPVLSIVHSVVVMALILAEW